MSSKLPSQMRMSYAYPKGREPQDVNRVSVKISKEFKLRDRVTDGVVNKRTPCLFELSLVLSCLSENNFNDKICVDQVNGLRDCCKGAMRMEETLKHRRLNPKKLEYSNNLIAAEINSMFQMYKK